MAAWGREEENEGFDLIWYNDTGQYANGAVGLWWFMVQIRWSRGEKIKI